MTDINTSEMSFEDAFKYLGAVERGEEEMPTVTDVASAVESEGGESSEAVADGEVEAAADAGTGEHAAEVVPLEVVKRLEHQRESDAGRIAALQRKVFEMEQFVDAARQQAGTPNRVEAKENGETDEELARIAEDFPEMAGALDKLVSKRVASLVGPQLQQLEQYQQQQYALSQVAALDVSHPGWRETIRDPAFQAWMESKPRGFQALMGSFDASDYGFVLDSFRAMSGQAQAPAVNPAAVAVQEKRKQQLAASVEVKGTGVTKRDGVPPDDFHGAWEFLKRQDEQRRRVGR